MKRKISAITSPASVPVSGHAACLNPFRIEADGFVVIAGEHGSGKSAFASNIHLWRFETVENRKDLRIRTFSAASATHAELAEIYDRKRQQALIAGQNGRNLIVDVQAYLEIACGISAHPINPHQISVNVLRFAVMLMQIGGAWGTHNNDDYDLLIIDDACAGLGGQALACLVEYARARTLSGKQPPSIILTTRSPMLIDHVENKELAVALKSANGKCSLHRMVQDCHGWDWLDGASLGEVWARGIIQVA